MTRATRWLRLAGTAAFFVGLALVVVGQLAGVRAVPVLSGSMTPYAPQGSLVLTAPLDSRDVAVGQVVAFVPPAPYVRDGHPVMHRAVAVEDVDGVPVMTTRGDANPQTDPWRIALPGADLGRAVAVLPGLGWAVMAGPVPAVMLLFGVACAVEGALMLRRRACTCAPTSSTAETPTAEALEPASSSPEPEPEPEVVIDVTAPRTGSPDVALPAPRRELDQQSPSPRSAPRR